MFFRTSPLFHVCPTALGRVSWQIELGSHRLEMAPKNPGDVRTTYHYDDEHNDSQAGNKQPALSEPPPHAIFPSHQIAGTVNRRSA
jgi:hypothetical protein